MIVGNLKDFRNVKFDNENINKAFEFIYSNNLLELPLGKTVIDGDNVWVNRMSYLGKDFTECTLGEQRAIQQFKRLFQKKIRQAPRQDLY